METTNSRENQQRRVEDRKPSETINWEAPGEPAVPVAAGRTPPANAGAAVAVFEGYDGDTLAPVFKLLRQVQPGEKLYLAGAAPAATSGDAPADLLFRAKVADLVHLLPWDINFADGDRATGEQVLDDVRKMLREPAARIESAAAPQDAPAAFAKRYSELLCENRRLKAQVESAAAPAFKDAEELAAWLDSLHESGAGGTVSNRKWEPAQRAAAAIRAAAPAPKPANLEDAPEGEQEWAKIDPATAFHLIERHAENWADAGRMMLAWRDANPAPATASGDELPSLPATEYKLSADSKAASLYDLEAVQSIQREAYELGKARAAVSAATKPTASRQAMQEAWQVLMDAGVIPGPEATSLANGIRSLLATKPAAAPANANPISETELKHLRRLVRNVGVHDAESLEPENAMACFWSLIHSINLMIEGKAASTTGAAQTAEQVRAIYDAVHSNAAPFKVEYALSQVEEVSVASGLLRDLFDAAGLIERPTPTHSSEAGDATT